jgi:hypothetical protein
MVKYSRMIWLSRREWASLLLFWIVCGLVAGVLTFALEELLLFFRILE